ncbi:MAG: hypothetical protein ACP6IU_09800 [Candidatus Asgardarchaeia archaeon]
MDLRRLIIEKKVVIVLDPTLGIGSADDFYSKYGSSLEQVAIVAKPPSGKVYYPSKFAHEDEKYKDFFSSFASLGTQLGIDIYAVINTFADTTFGKDPYYKTFNTEGDAFSSYVCPNQEAFWDYLGAISQEVIDMEIQGIILTGLSYVRRDFCACKKCKTEFSKRVGINEHFTFDNISASREILEEWKKWRVSKLTSALERISNKIWEVRKDAYIIPTIYIDSETKFKEGAELEFGQDPLAFSDITGNIAVHINPWSPILPDTDSDEYAKLVDNLMFTKEVYSHGYPFSLFFWGSVDERDIAILSKIADDINASTVYISPTYPDQYYQWREVHLGLV